MEVDLTNINNRRVAQIALPMMLSNITVPLLGFVDTAVIGQLGDAKLIAALGLGSILISTLYWLCGFLRMGTTGLTAQAIGSKQTDEVFLTLLRGLLLGIFLILTVYWDVGSGYNEYNRNSQQVIIQRKGFPGPNRKLQLTFAFSQIKSVKIKIKEGLNPTRQILLCLFDNREIPVVGIEQPEALNKIEDEAISIAKHLNVFLETE